MNSRFFYHFYIILATSSVGCFTREACTESVPFQDLARRAARAIEQQDYDQALEIFQEIIPQATGNPRAYYNLGTLLYQLGNYEGAREQFNRALELEDNTLQPWAAYNLGNTLLKSALEWKDLLEMGQSEPGGENPGEKALQFLQEASRAYMESLILDPGRQDAQGNLEVAMREIEVIQNILTQTPQPPGTPQPQEGTPPPTQSPGTETPTPQEDEQKRTPAPSTPSPGDSDSETPTPEPTTPTSLPPMMEATQTPTPSADDGTPTPTPQFLSPQQARELIEQLAEEVRREQIQNHRREGPDW